MDDEVVKHFTTIARDPVFKTVGMLDLLPLLPIIGKHAVMLQTLSNMAPELELLVNEIWPHVQEINTAILRHKKVIDRVQELTPEIQELVTEALPYVQQMK
jgi:hypothetical protein